MHTTTQTLAADFINRTSCYTQVIDLTNCGLTEIPDLSKFKNLKILHCSFNNLKTLPKLNDSIEEIYCNYNKLIELPPLPKNLKILYCSSNNLNYLPTLNAKLENLDCSYNSLENLPMLFNTSLKILNCSHNKLKTLPPLPSKLRQLSCNNNNLYCLPDLSITLGILNLTNNPFEEAIYLHCIYKDCKKIPYNPSTIHGYKDMTKISNRNKIINQFRFTYYALKYKKQFSKWLWEKVREPKIMHKFHLYDFKDVQENNI